MIWAVAGRKGSAGATSLAVLLAQHWPAEDAMRFVVEADPEGGVLAARWHAIQGTTHEPGLLTLAATRDGDAVERLRHHTQTVLPGLGLVAGPPGPAQAEATLRALGDGAPTALAATPVPCFVDCGRLHVGSAALPWALRAERVLFVIRPRLDEVVALRAVGDGLAGAGLNLGLVCIGDRPFHPLEVAEQTGVALAGVVADDRVAAACITDGLLEGRGLRRSRLARTAADLARQLASSVPEAQKLDDPASDRGREPELSGARR